VGVKWVKRVFDLLRVCTARVLCVLCVLCDGWVVDWLCVCARVWQVSVQAFEAGHVSLKRLLAESSWLQFTSECQRFGHPPRLNN
jgi:hypothetical protein